MVYQLIGKEIETQQDQPVYYTHVVNEVKWNISTMCNVFFRVGNVSCSEVVSSVQGCSVLHRGSTV